MSFWDEIRKIPPVTRVLCGSSLAVTIPVILQLLSPYKVVFVKELVTRRYEIWRVYTSFFLGGSGLSYLFEFIMLYRNSNQLEEGYYPGRSADYAWQLLWACAGIITLNIPLKSFVHGRPLLLALTYLTSKLAPAGSQTSLFGLISLPVAYFPYALIFLDLLMGGPAAAAASVTGAVIGHVWWWGVFESRGWANMAQSPEFLKDWIDGDGRRPGNLGGGVQVIPPRRRERERTAGTSTGYQWGTGRRLAE